MGRNCHWRLQTYKDLTGEFKPRERILAWELQQESSGGSSKRQRDRFIDGKRQESVNNSWLLRAVPPGSLEGVWGKESMHWLFLPLQLTADWEISPGLHLRFSRTSKKRFKGRIFGCDLGRKVTKKKITTAASFNWERRCCKASPLEWGESQAKMERPLRICHYSVPFLQMPVAVRLLAG